MSPTETEHKRQDDSFYRKVMVGLTLAIIVNAISWAYQIGIQNSAIAQLQKDVKLNTDNINKFSDGYIKVNKKLTAIEIYIKLLLGKQGIEVSGNGG